MLLAISAVAWLVLVWAHEPGPGEGDLVSLDLPEGGDVAALSAQLGEEGVVASPWLFSAYLRLLGAGDSLRVGSVRMPDDLSPAEVAARVARGLGPVRVRVLIPEGFHRHQVAARLAELGICDADRFRATTADPAFLARYEIDAPTAEGYLFPDTYQFRQEVEPARVAGRMIENFRRRVFPLLDARSEDFARLRREHEFSLREVVSLASIVEKEAAVHDERETVAGVFLNRLGSETFLPRRRLQADPTVSYGCVERPGDAASCAGFSGRITRAMLDDPDNRYNTYRHGGLPPGPISNPGLGSIRAVLAPVTHDYLYFVARGGRRHAFSATLEEHERNVDRYIRGRSEAP